MTNKNTSKNVKVLSPMLKGMRKNKPLKFGYERLGVQSALIILVLFLTAFSFLPLILTVLNSVKLEEQVKTNIFGLPAFSTIAQAFKENYSVAWKAIEGTYFNTLAISLIGAVIETLVGSVLAYILTFKQFYFKNAIFILFIAVLLVPSIIGYPVLIPLIRDTFKLGDEYFGYLLPMVGGAQVTGMFLFKTFFGQQPKSLYECASIEGANDFKVYFTITLPLALPIVLYYFVGCFAGIYNEYLWASLILDKNQTLANIMYAVVDNNTVNYGSMYAMYIISSLPLIVTTVISMRYFKSGEFAAGLKL